MGSRRSIWKEAARRAARAWARRHPHTQRLDGAGGRRRPGDDPRVQAAVAAQDALSRLAPGSGEDSSADVRRWREAG